MGTRIWMIEGHRGTEVFWFRELPYGIFSERRIETLLKYLVAKYGLDDDETVNAFAKRNSRLFKPHLEIQRSGSTSPWSISCGGNPYFTARVEERD
ncbi:hypothetical protein SAMN04244572_03994 [Azotobacter beijerinckii]|uniref:Uncharacterized protein n=1 Tax=Azotobacter beijerinckii TaxID=170623 RepID=A0A1H6YWM6_9GAMM|nr:hypothetical protein SAMN04244572_03994 [Azotobacter beijerinckii]